MWLTLHFGNVFSCCCLQPVASCQLPLPWLESLIRAARLHTRVKFIAISFYLFALSLLCCPPIANLQLAAASARPLSKGLSHIISLFGNKMFHIVPSPAILSVVHVSPVIWSSSLICSPPARLSVLLFSAVSRAIESAFSLRSQLESDSNHMNLMK